MKSVLIKTALIEDSFYYSHHFQQQCQQDHLHPSYQELDLLVDLKWFQADLLDPKDHQDS